MPVGFQALFTRIGSHMAAPAKRKNASYVNFLLNYLIWRKLYCRARLVVESISKSLKICSMSENILIYQVQIPQKHLVVEFVSSVFLTILERIQAAIKDFFQELDSPKA